MSRLLFSNLFVIAVMLASVFPVPTMAAPNLPANSLATLPSAMMIQAPGVAGSKLVPETTPQTEGLELRLQRATFDPLVQTPALPSALRSSDYPGDGSGYYLVQFNGPILSEWKDALQKHGAIIFDYIPQFAYIVRMNSATAVRVQSLDSVRWVGLYQPAFRISTGLDQVIATQPAETVRIVVRSFTGEPSDALLNQFKQLNAVVRDAGKDSGGGSIFKLELPSAAIPAIARLSSVAWVEPWVEPTFDNAIARSNLAMNKNGVESRLGLYGAGQIVVVGDSGVSTGNPSTIHADFSGRVYSGTTGPGSTCHNWVDAVDHGTHVAGSVLGSGYRSGAVTTTHAYSGTNAGIAPEALLFAWGFCDNFTGLPDTDPYTDYYHVMYNADSRVRVNTNSWGRTNQHGLYDTFSKETDRFLWDHRDMTVLYSAGNDGTDANSNGIVDTGSVGVPASSKNVITVGASENYRMTGGYNPGGVCSTWGTCWPGDFPTNPVHDDRLSNNVSGMVAFSGRGPTLDGRLKPDVVAPGSNIVSTRYPGANTGWGVYDAYYLYMGGTSMATPLVAGGSAVVREFYSDNYGITSPTAALVKATLINGAYDMTPGQYGSGATQDVIRRPDINQGWGRVDLYNSLVYDAPRKLWFYQHTAGLTTTQDYSVTLRITDTLHPFRTTLVWTDYPGTEAANGGLVNDLDLTVIAPNGTTYTGNDLFGDGSLDGDVDHVNNVEGIDIASPQRGDYVVRVRAYNTPQGPQPFALVASGDLIQVWTSCYARINSGATFSSTDADAVQQAVDAAVTSGTVRVAGTCVGVQSRAGTSQSVYISKTLTLRGGYTTTNWTTSDPIANPTTLDAFQNGRVVVLSSVPVLLQNMAVSGNSDKDEAAQLLSPTGPQAPAVAITVTLENVTVQGGLISGNGGGIYDNDALLILSNSIIRENVATNYGGGILVNTGSAMVSGGRFFSNTAFVGGGLAVLTGAATVSATQMVSNTASDAGGGIRSAGVLTVAGTTLSSNTAAYGGGIANRNTLTLINSTLSGNQATGSSYGGGAIDQYQVGPVPSATILNCTIVSNTATIPSRSGIFLEAGTFNIGNSIVAHNGVTNNVAISGGAFTSLGYNLTNSGAGTPFTATGDLINTNPLLGPLQDNDPSTGSGQATWTHAPLLGSPAIDRIPNSVNGCGTTITTDQRGVGRPVPAGGSCDVGAVEAQRLCFARVGAGTTFISEDAAAVQAAVDAAPAGDTVKVAGICTGVQPRAGTNQTVYISKTLTLRGGYTSTNWTTLDPVANPTALDARQSGRVVYLTGGISVNVTLENMTMRNGNARGNDGGGIYNNGTLTLTNSSVRNVLNTNRGGGIYNLSALTLNHTNIVNNTAAWGGGLYNNGTLMISASTFASNTTTGNGGGLNINTGVASVINSTFSGNSAQAVYAQGGGGIMAWSGALTLTHVTLTGNSAPTGGGIFRQTAATAVQNTIIANSASGGNCSGTLSSLGYNLSSDATCANFTATGDLINTNPLLGPLQDNGPSTGSGQATWTHAPLLGSPAIDRIPTGVNGCGTTVTTDQRGVGRPVPAGGSCDVGAVEVQRLCFTRVGAGTTFVSEDAAAVQAAVDAAPAGDTVKVAGICTGVQLRAGTNQTVYISKTLTLRGGYTTTNWTTSNPVANPTALDASQSGRVVYLTGGISVSVTLENLTVRNGSTGSSGGGILNNFSVLNVINTTVSDNSANMGGGIRNEQGALTVANSTVANNRSSWWGGGIANYSGTLTVSNSTFTGNISSGYGGGIADNGHLTVTNSTFAGNSAQRGGGLFVYWGLVSVNNSTFSGNNSASGGAMEYLFNPTPAALALASLPGSERASGSANPEAEAAPHAILAVPSATMLNCTVISNTAANANTSGIWLEGGTLNIGNSIVANNSVTNNVAISGGTFTSLGYNLTNSGAGTPFTATGDLINTNPLLGPLQDNGGASWTHALLPGSPAIDLIPFGMNGCGTTITTDQRGQPRPGTFTHVCDVGAYEAQNVYYQLYLPIVMRN